MRKITLQLFVAISFVFYGFVTHAFAFELNQDSLKGKVKSYTQHYYLATMNNGLVVKGEWHMSLPYNFEAEVKDYVHIHKKKYYNGTGTIMHHDQFYYNNNNQLIEKHSVTNDLVVLSKEFYTHDHKGRKASEQFFHYLEKHHGKNVEYNYTHHEDTIEVKHYNHESILQNKTIHVLNPLKQETKKLVYDSNSKLIEKIDYIYNSKGLLSFETFYNEKGVIKYKKRYHYDHLKNKILDETIDINGNVTKSLHREISYDTHGNWIQINHFEDGTPVYIIQRNIAYF